MLMNDVFAVPVFDQWLVHAPLHRATAVCGESLVIGLATDMLPEVSGDAARFVEALQGPPAPPPAGKTGRFEPDFLGIIPTRSCNLACRYCAFGACEDDGDAMDLSMARGVVEWMADRVAERGDDVLAIDFFGGEPMIAPEVVETAIDTCRRLAVERGWRSRTEMATNGYYDGKRRDFVSRNIDNLMLSFDGPAEVHDMHRPLKNGHGSYETVAASAAAFSAGPADLSIRVCSTAGSVGRIEQDTEWLCREFKPSYINFEPLRPTPESARAGLAPPDPWQFARAAHHASRLAARHGVRIMHAAAMVDALRSAFCPIGRDVPILSPDGKVAACYMLEKDIREAGLNLHLGEAGADGRPVIGPDDMSRVRQVAELPEECRTCFCCRHCAGGCRVAMQGSRRREGADDFCMHTRILSACRLLDRLGCAELADRLAEDREAQEKLALRTSDLIEEWELGRGSGVRVSGVGSRVGQ